MLGAHAQKVIVLGLCMCVLVKSHLASVHPENTVMYLAGNG